MLALKFYCFLLEDGVGFADYALPLYDLKKHLSLFELIQSFYIGIFKLKLMNRNH